MTDTPNPPVPADRFFRRRLPHWQPAGATIFLTWRLYGCLPQEALDRLAAERRLLERQPIRPDETARDRALRHNKRLFALADEMLARNIDQPQWLRDEQIARLMVDALFYHNSNLYVLLAFVVMPNHVHVVVQPLEKGAGQTQDEEQDKVSGPHQAQASIPCHVPVRRITHSLKGYTAREANRPLKRIGQPFWQDETYDHWVRDEAELGRIVTYIEWDPVRAGLAANPAEWCWSLAWERKWGRLKDQSWWAD